jgi:hypothetical protein
MAPMRSLSDSSRLGRFLLVTFGWSWPLQILSLWLSPLQRKVVLAVSMWAPALGALAATGAPWREAFRRLYRPPGLPCGHARAATVAALVLPPATVVAAVALSVWLGVARLNPAHPPWGKLAGIVIAAACLAPVANFPAALGEELGWRGFLYPMLSAAGPASRRRAAMLWTGAIWGVWHAPLVVAGFNYPGHPWLAVPMMIGLSMIINVLLVGLARLGGTMTAPTLAHGSMNGTAGLATVLLVGGDSAVAAPSGVVAWVPLAVAAALVTFLGRLARERRGR